MNNLARDADSRQNLTLVVERVFAARRERVFRAWTDAALLARWFAPSGTQPVGVEAHAAAGGSYRIGMRDADGVTSYVSGKYLQVVPPERLVFTWAWESDPPEAESLVTIEFFEQGGATRVRLRHEKLADAQSQARHRRGWESCLDQLQASLASGSI